MKVTFFSSLSEVSLDSFLQAVAHKDGSWLCDNIMHLELLEKISSASLNRIYRLSLVKGHEITAMRILRSHSLRLQLDQDQNGNDIFLALHGRMISLAKELFSLYHGDLPIGEVERLLLVSCQSPATGVFAAHMLQFPSLLVKMSDQTVLEAFGFAMASRSRSPLQALLQTEMLVRRIPSDILKDIVLRLSHSNDLRTGYSLQDSSSLVQKLISLYHGQRMPAPVLNFLEGGGVTTSLLKAMHEGLKIT